jgi:hypothetical protein
MKIINATFTLTILTEVISQRDLSVLSVTLTGIKK